MAHPVPPAEQLLDLFDRIRQIALRHNPMEARGVSGPQLVLLDWVAAKPGCGVQDLARALKLTPPTVSVTVRRLEAAGLLERQANPQDGRATRFFLTAAGKTLHRQARTFRQKKMQAMLAGLTADERDTLIALLVRAVSAAETAQTKSTHALTRVGGASV